MKKIMMFLAAVAATVAVNAATVDWNYQITGAAGGTATDFVGYTAYLVDATYFSGLSLVTEESITGSGNYIQSATLAQTGTSGKGSNKKYVFSTGAQAYANSSLTKGTEYSYYLVLVDASGENYYAQSYSYTARDATDTYTADAIKLAVLGTAVSSGMKPWDSDTPEPTSGLLLLVGGAMLALRRKQK